MIEGIARVFYNKAPFNLYILVLFVFCPFLFMFVLKSSSGKVMIARWLAVLALFGIAFSFSGIRESAFLIFTCSKIIIQPEKYSNCIENAIPLEGGGKFGVCEFHSTAIETELGIDASYSTTAIIYDSSDQVAKKPYLRTVDWEKVAYSLRSKAPFGIDAYNCIVKNLVRHYYYVFFTTRAINNSNMNKFSNNFHLQIRAENLDSE